jgi:hypothetical protein
MSHQPFETWLLSNQTLDTQQQQSLAAHLSECKQCNTLSRSLLELSTLFSDSQSATPAPGFTRRWHTRLSVYRQKRQHQNLWIFTLGLLGLASLIFMVLLLNDLNSFNWTYELSQIIASISRFAIRINQFMKIFNTLINSLPFLIPIIIIIGMGIFSSMIALIITWFISIINLYKPYHEGGTVR